MGAVVASIVGDDDNDGGAGGRQPQGSSHEAVPEQRSTCAIPAGWPAVRAAAVQCSPPDILLGTAGTLLLSLT